MSSEVLKEVANRELEQMGVAITVSAEWVRRTLMSLNLTYNSTKPQAKVVPKETELEAQAPPFHEQAACAAIAFGRGA